MSRKAVCSKHEQAFEVSAGCPYCEPAFDAPPASANTDELVAAIERFLIAESFSRSSLIPPEVLQWQTTSDSND